MPEYTCSDVFTPARSAASTKEIASEYRISSDPTMTSSGEAGQIGEDQGRQLIARVRAGEVVARSRSRGGNAHDVPFRVADVRLARHREVSPRRDAYGRGRQRYSCRPHGDHRGYHHGSTARVARQDDLAGLESLREEIAVGGRCASIAAGNGCSGACRYSTANVRPRVLAVSAEAMPRPCLSEPLMYEPPWKYRKVAREGLPGA